MIQQQVYAAHDDFADAKDVYWKIVRDSLVELFGLSTRTATSRVRTVRQRIESRTGPGHLSLAYHAEPYDVARDMAGQDVPWEDHQAAYWRIVARHDPYYSGSVAAPNRPSPPFS